MGSDVVFDSLYLDRCLRFGWYLDIIMLLLLGVASLMFRSDSVVFGLSGSYAWWWMIWCHRIFMIYQIFDVILGHIPFRARSIDLHRVACLFQFMRCTLRWLIGSLFYDDPSVEPLWSLCGAIQPGPHFSAFGCRHASYLGRHSLVVWIWFASQRSHVRW